MKKALSLILCVVLLISLLAACGGGREREEEESEPLEWEVVELKDYLPEPKDLECELSVDRKDLLSFDAINTSKAEFKKYREACIEMGYTIDSEDTGDVYDAFNSEGYNVRLIFSDDEFSVSLEAPEQMDTITWPKTGLGAMLPATKSTLGRISRDYSDIFVIYVGETTLEDFSAYVTLCESHGFNVNHSKSEGFYKAENAEGYTLTIYYRGFNTIEVDLTAPEWASGNNAATTVPTKAPVATKPATNDKIGADFKAAMDAYEEFIDEYVDIVKKYTKNPTDFTILASYGEYMGKYATMVVEFEKWENEELNAAETAYYVQVQGRVTKKLLEVAQ